MRASLPRLVLYCTGAVSLGLNTLFLWPVLARHASPDLLGQLATHLTLVGLLSPAAAAGLHIYVLRHAAHPDPQVRHQAVRVAVASIRSVIGPAVGLALVLLPFWPAAGSAILAVLCTGAGLVVVALMRGLDRPWSFAVLTLGGQTVAPAAAAMALVRTGSVNTAMLVFAAVVVLPAVVASRDAASPATRPDRVATGRVATRQDDRSVLAEALRFSVPLMPHLVLILALVQGIRVLVAVTQGYSAAGYFQFAAMLGGFPITAVLVLRGHWSTCALRCQDDEAFYRETLRYGQRLAWMSVALAVIAGVSALQLLPMLLPSSYPVRPIALAIAALLPAVTLQCVGDLQAEMALRSGKGGSVSIATGIGACVGAAVVPLADGSLGLAAGGLAVSAGLSARALVSVLYLRRDGIRIVLSTQLRASVAACLLVGVGVAIMV
ncbi:lipopolysaccharide biosynthesis protein [Streptomyces sp. NPDC006602]|uniref:lipopolysaccharide biosynthesis protein n=1 Tax=Streptomyces sp. NPDC006602 TaxID=3364751 RepID=UPI0036B1CB65